MRKKWIALLLTAVMSVGLWGCSGNSNLVIYVQNVGQILKGGAVGMNNQFAGMVVTEDPVKIEKDSGKPVSQVYVQAGDTVAQGDILFEYDSEALSLSLSKQELELERIKNNISSLNSQISQLENEKKKANKNDQLNYTVEIQDRQAQLKEAEYNQKVKQQEIETTRTDIQNTKVHTPIQGRISSVNDSGEGPYMIIQQTGAFRIKGKVNELNLSGLQEGQNVVITSRADETVRWNGTVSAIDLESPEQSENNENGMVGGMMGDSQSNAMAESSSYVFYVEPETTDGMMLGKHVFIQPGTALDSEKQGLWLPEYFLVQGEENTAYVWAETPRGTLEKRSVTIGSYDQEDLTYEILDGLTTEDYIAFPSEFCRPGAKTTRNQGEELLPEETGAVSDGNLEEEFIDDLGEQIVTPQEDFVGEHPDDQIDPQDESQEFQEPQTQEEDNYVNQASSGQLVDDTPEGMIVGSDGELIPIDYGPASDGSMGEG